MEIQGQVKEIMPIQSGISKAGKEWQKQDFVIEVLNGEYLDNICFNMFGDNIEKLNIGDNITAQINIRSRDWTGKDGVKKWFIDIQAWKVEVVQVQEAPQAQAPNIDITPEDGDDLPF